VKKSTSGRSAKSKKENVRIPRVEPVGVRPLENTQARRRVCEKGVAARASASAVDRGARGAKPFACERKQQELTF